MKRRGFLGLLAALPGLALLRKADAAPVDAVIQPLPYKQPSKELFDLIAGLEETRRLAWDGDIKVDYGKGDDTVVFSVWQSQHGRFVQMHEWCPRADKWLS